MGTKKNQYYLEVDNEFIDYKLWSLTGLDDILLRGPKPKKDLTKDNYISFIGAAQTFGRYVEDPYPFLLANMLEKEILNLGVGGCGPEFFYQNDRIMDKINDSKFAVIQIMSGRSVSTSRYKTKGGNRFAQMTKDNKIISIEEYLNEIIAKKNYREASQILFDIRASYVKHYIKLLKKIEVPKILFWCSHRNPSYELRLNNYINFSGGFPQFINGDIVYFLRQFTQGYLEYKHEKVTQIIEYTNQKGEKLSRKNRYYPTQEMHFEVAKKLFDYLKACRIV